MGARCIRADAVPARVLTVTWPDPVLPGTLMPMVVAVVLLAELRERLTLSLSSTAVGSTYVPVTATAVPVVAMLRLKLPMVGGPVSVVIAKPPLVAVPFGVVTIMVPVAAPEGTLVVSWLAAAGCHRGGGPLLAPHAPDELFAERNGLPCGKRRGIVSCSRPSFRARHGIQSGLLDTGFRRYDTLAASQGE